MMQYVDDNTKLLLHAEDFSDSSYYNNQYSNNTMIIEDNGKFGKCFRINRTKCDYNISNLSTKNCTIDFWVKLNNTSGYPTIFSTTVVPSAIRGVYGHIDGGYPSFNTSNSTTIKSNTPLQANQWTHIAFVINNGNGLIFMNGLKVAEGVLQEVIIDKIFIGRLIHNNADDGATYIDGYLDEFRVSDVARWVTNFTPPTTPYIEIPKILIKNKDKTSLDFSITYSGSLSKVEVFVNNNLMKTYTSEFNNLTFIFDLSNSKYVKGKNIIKIVPTFNTSNTVDFEISHYIGAFPNTPLNAIITEFEDILSNISNPSISNQSIDIISARELPAYGKDGRICIITDNPVNNFFIGHFDSDIPKDFDGISIYLTNTPHMKPFESLNSNIKLRLHFLYIKQNGKLLSSYIYKNNNWEVLTEVTDIIFNEDIYNFNSGVASSYIKYENSYTYGNITFPDNRIKVSISNDKGVGGPGDGRFTLNEKINLTPYSRLRFNIVEYYKANHVHSSFVVCITDGTTESANVLSSKRFDYNNASGGGISSNIVGSFEFDISMITGERYIQFRLYTGGAHVILKSMELL